MVGDTQIPQDVPGNHAKLVGMLAGLGVALSAAGKSLGTHGREGGAPDVVAYYQEQAQAQRAQEDQQMKQADFQLRTKALTAQQNLAEFQLQKAKDFLPLEHQDLLNKLNEESVRQLGELGIPPIVAVSMVAGQSTAEHASTVLKSMPGGSITGGVAIPTQTGAHGEGSGSTNVYSVDALNKPTTPEFVSSMLPFIKQSIDMAEANGADPKAVEQARSVTDTLSHGTSMPVGDFLKVQNQITVPVTQSASVAQQKLKTQKEQAELAKTQAANQQEALKNEQAKGSNDLYNANVERDSRGAPTQDFATWQATKTKAAEQAVEQGDPTPIGTSMATGILAPSQVLSTRSMSKPFYGQVLAAADASAKAQGMPEIKGANGQGTGHYYDPATAEAQFTYAKNVQVQNMLNAGVAIGGPGGAVDVVRNAIKALPELNSKSLNSLFNMAATEFGSAQETAAHQAIVTLAGEYATVLGRGTPSDSLRQEILEGMKTSYSKKQFEGGLDIIQQDVNGKGRATVNPGGKLNPVLSHIYPQFAGGQNGTTGGSFFGKFKVN
jgi:hypothetical protein